MKENYKEIEDFLSDETFIDWVKKSNKKNIEEWDLWMAEHPSESGLAMKAADFFHAFSIADPKISDSQINNAELRLLNAINNISKPAKVIEISRKKTWYWTAAASVIFLVGLGIFFFSRPAPKLQFATNYGEIEKNKLPDGTEVILNANTQLTFGKVWKEGKTRDVWIKGEAYFHVKKTQYHDKFIVHTDAFDIEVTGTSFNVINENGKSSVVLTEGSVKIHREGINEILMKPGDLVQFDNSQLEKKVADQQLTTAWTDNKLIFNNTPISEVAAIIKRHYGISVKIDDDSIAKKTITGIMPNNNLDVLLESLNATQEFRVTKSNASIIIKEYK